MDTAEIEASRALTGELHSGRKPERLRPPQPQASRLITVHRSRSTAGSGTVRPAVRHQMTRGPHREPEELMAEPAILINAFEVPAAEADAFVAAWQKARDYLRSQPGYIDTVLHQSITPDAEFQFVNVARWQTAEDFIAATQNPGFRQSAAGLARYRPHPALYRPVCT
jgi:heme-degrading monooxygenase HmoA